MNRRIDIQTIVFWCFFGIIVGCFAFLFIAYPKSYDDWWYWLECITFGEDAEKHDVIVSLNGNPTRLRSKSVVFTTDSGHEYVFIAPAWQNRYQYFFMTIDDISFSE